MFKKLICKFWGCKYWEWRSVNTNWKGINNLPICSRCGKFLKNLEPYE